MAAKTASLSVNIIADAAKARAGLKEAESAFGKFRREVGEAQGAMNKFQVVGGAALDSIKRNALGFATAAGAAIVAFAASSVKAASNLAESTNAVRVTFGKAAEGILDFGKKSSEAVGMSARQFNEFAVSFAGFGEKIAGAGGDIVKITTDITKRVADFASVMNLDMAEASQVFQSSLAGQTEPIRKFGIDLSAAAVEAYALSSGLISSKNQLTETIKVQARYGLLMEKTSKFAGDFTNTQDSMANATRTLQAKVEDLQAQLGEKLLPAMEDLLQVSIELVDAFAALGSIPGVSEFFDNIGKADFSFFKLGTLVAQDLLSDLFNLNEESKTGYQVTTELKGAWVDGYRAMITARREVDDLAAAIRNQAEDVEEAKTKWQKFKDELSVKQETLSVLESIEEFRVKWAGATDEAKAKSREYRAELLQNQAEVANLALSIMGLATTAQNTRIRLLIETGQLERAWSLIQAIQSGMNSLAGAVTPDRVERLIGQAGGVGGTVYTNPGTGSGGSKTPTTTKAPAKTGGGSTGGSNVGGRRDIRMMATGGTVVGSGMAMVGEEGPELVNLPRGASVIPTIPSRKMMGGGMTINVQVQAGLVSSPDQVGAQIIDAIRRAERRSGQVFASAI